INYSFAYFRLALKRFYIQKLKDGFYDPLKLMVSVDNPAVSFILYPHVNGESLFDKKSLCNFAKAYDRERNEVDIYSVVTVREPNGHLHLTTNLKAPIVLDRNRQKGWQHILTSKDSDLAFPLEGLSKSFQKVRAQSHS
ncbi:MAG: flagellar assembly protein FliW, partial [Alphaproteobacteria bacterium]|nr:flagellar assembly protein FliW [Alphaproteobacteria bacterium]